MAKSDCSISSFESILRGEIPEERLPVIVIGNAYLYAYKKNLIFSKDGNLVSVANEINKYLPDDLVLKLDNLFNQIGIDGIRNLLYELLLRCDNKFSSSVEPSSKSIDELVINLLKMNDEGHVVMDFGSGRGSFLASVYKKAHEDKFILKGLFGVEINVEQAHISQMALSILSDGSVDPKIIIGNALNKSTFTYTRAYTFPPLGMRRVLSEERRRSFLFSSIYLSNKNTAEWLFIDNMLSGLLGDRAIGLVTGMALFNNADVEYRNQLIKSGWLEGIIELPTGSLPFIRTKVYVLVFSKENKVTKFVDASNVIESRNRRYINIELPVRKIIDMYNAKDVKTKTAEELIDLPNLCPSIVTLDVKKLENGVKLNEVADIFLGNQYTSGVFEKKGRISEKRTGYRILTLSDIEDGIIHWNSLRSVEMDDEKFDKYAVKNGDVIVTSKSSRVKTAVVDIELEEKILVTCGMLIVRPHTDKLNPIYLKMFLDSNMGQSALKSIQKGTFITTITIQGLSSIEIPMIDIKEQQTKAEKYSEKLSTLIAYKRKIESIENSLKTLFDEKEK